MPRRHAATQLIRNERKWLPQIATFLPLPVPTLVRVGLPSCGYPNHWNIISWLDGQPADLAPPADSQAVVFAHFLNALHLITPHSNAPENLVRGVPLAYRKEVVEARMERIEKHTNCVTPKIKSIWNDALEAPTATRSCWLHGDLHSQNVLVHQGIISGIIDWGDITAGDPATDLASVWMLFDSESARQQCLETYGLMDEALCLRAKGWAVLFGAMLLDSGLVNNPRHAAIGEAVLRRVQTH